MTSAVLSSENVVVLCSETACNRSQKPASADYVRLAGPVYPLPTELIVHILMCAKCAYVDKPEKDSSTVAPKKTADTS